jgi:hypothetical protein
VTKFSNLPAVRPHGSHRGLPRRVFPVGVDADDQHALVGWPPESCPAPTPEPDDAKVIDLSTTGNVKTPQARAASEGSQP